ncbi:TIGR02450 family Trp-rich protein [Chitinimonas taiwanensis]|uniref:TIGR02450 family Trp-rich protein n=1 Tax=Chitinimonas taiwanensis TaxID=240412 RepID=UPI0035B3B4CB
MPNRLQPKKLLLSKWTAVQPQQREKHFLVSKVIQPEDPLAAIEWIALEAVLTKRVQILRWQALKDEAVWRAGWH